MGLNVYFVGILLMNYGLNYGCNVRFCWDFIDRLCAEIMGLNVYFVGILLMNYGLKLWLQCMILLEFY